MHFFIIFAHVLVHMEELLEISESLIRKVPVGFKRYLYSKINWNNRLIGIKGARGAGKTTMLLQWLKSVKKPFTEIAYLSLDDLYFTTHSLVDTARSFYLQGGKVLVLDEVHKYASWAREIKNLYDRYPDLQIIFTGSSIIDISKQEADISRRAVMYELSGLSFREYLELHYNLRLPVIQLEEILSPETSLRDVFPFDFKPLAYFKEYLQYGYYPFFMEGKENYYQRITIFIFFMKQGLLTFCSLPQKVSQHCKSRKKYILITPIFYMPYPNRLLQ